MQDADFWGWHMQHWFQNALSLPHNSRLAPMYMAAWRSCTEPWQHLDWYLRCVRNVLAHQSDADAPLQGEQYTKEAIEILLDNPFAKGIGDLCELLSMAQEPERSAPAWAGICPVSTFTLK